MTVEAVRLAAEDGESVLASVDVVEDMVVGHGKRTLTYDLEVDHDVEAALQLVAGGESLVKVRGRMLASNAGGVEEPIVRKGRSHRAKRQDHGRAPACAFRPMTGYQRTARTLIHAHARALSSNKGGYGATLC